jgi:hypothetical protein
MDSGYFSTGWIVGVLVGVVLGLVLAVAIGGALLRLAVKWRDGFAPGYLRCCGVVALSGVLGAIATFAIGGVFTFLRMRTGVSLDGGVGWMPGLLASALGFAVSVLVTGAVVQFLVRRPDGGTLPYARAIAIAAIYLAMAMALYLACIFGFLLAVGGVPGVSR